MKKEFSRNHGMAWCDDCGWKTEEYKNAQATAAIHAKKHKHKVFVEVGMSGYYDGRTNPNPPNLTKVSK